MPRSAKRSRAFHPELVEAAAEALGKPLHAAPPGTMKREDSSEAASAITLSPIPASHKGQQQASECPPPQSQSTQSSEGCEFMHQHLMLSASGSLDAESKAIQLLDLTKQTSWELVDSILDEQIAALLLSNTTDTTRHVMRVQCQLPCNSEKEFYARCSTSEEVEPVTCTPDFRDAVPVAEARTIQACFGSEEGFLGKYWQKKLRVSAKGKQQESSALTQVIEALSAVLPEELQPATKSHGSSWLSFSEAGTAATDIRLEIGSATWASGYTKSAAGLRPVYLSIAPGKAMKALLPEGPHEDAHRSWVILEDQESMLGPELVLRALKAESSGHEATAVAPWEETDSQAAVFGARNDLGTASEISQQPGQLLALQRHGHCSTASGGVFLSWNVATGADWPHLALAQGRVRSNAMRRAAVVAKNAWLGSESRQREPSLHVLRLLFTVACNLDRADDSLLEGLHRSFVPLLESDIRLQSECSLPDLNAKRGILESKHQSALRCSCCSGEFLFSFVRLIRRKGERSGSLCWECWSQREKLGLQQHCRNARKCIVFQQGDLQRLITAISWPPSPNPKRRRIMTTV